jgi:hypothetical protein
VVRDRGRTYGVSYEHVRNDSTCQHARAVLFWTTPQNRQALLPLFVRTTSYISHLESFDLLLGPIVQTIGHSPR